MKNITQYELDWKHSMQTIEIEEHKLDISWLIDWTENWWDYNKEDILERAWEHDWVIDKVREFILSIDSIKEQECKSDNAIIEIFNSILESKFLDKYIKNNQEVFLPKKIDMLNREKERLENVIKQSQSKIDDINKELTWYEKNPKQNLNRKKSFKNI